MSSIVSTLQMMCTDIWIAHHGIRNMTQVYGTNRISVTPDVEMFLYYSSPPIIRLHLDNDQIELSYEDERVDVFVKSNGSMDYCKLGVTEEEYFQLSLLYNYGWLTYDMFHYGSQACSKHYEFHRVKE